jgi:hypothetical protein
MAGKGKQFELDVKNAINEITPPRVKAHRPDFSGSSAGEVADVMVVWESERNKRFVDYIELKKRGNVDEGNRKVVMSGSSDGQSGVDELRELIDESPPWSRQWVGVKFPHRELIVLRASSLLEHLDGDSGIYAHGARSTRGHNISMVKPTLDEWPSSTSGRSDEQKILDVLGVDC